MLEFAIADDVAIRQLERGARRTLVGLFGPLNLFPLLFAAEHALGIVIEPWGDISREMVMTARRTMDEVLCKESEACFNSDEWMELIWKLMGLGLRMEKRLNGLWRLFCVVSRLLIYFLYRLWCLLFCFVRTPPLVVPPLATIDPLLVQYGLGG